MARQKQIWWEKWPRSWAIFSGSLGGSIKAKSSQMKRDPRVHWNAFSRNASSFSRESQNGLFDVLVTLAGHLFSPLPTGPALNFCLARHCVSLDTPHFVSFIRSSHKHTENSGLYTTHTHTHTIFIATLFLFFFSFSRLWNEAQGKSQTHDERIYYSPAHNLKGEVVQDLPQERVRWWSEPRTRGLCGTGGRPTQ